MYRTIFFNLWAALIAFAIYFGYAIYQSNGFALPLPTLAYSFMWAFIGFVVAYGLRYVLDYIFYTPTQAEISEEDPSEDNQNQVMNSSTVEFQDESPDEIAKVVKTMLHKDEPIFDK